MSWPQHHLRSSYGANLTLYERSLPQHVDDAAWALTPGWAHGTGSTPQYYVAHAQCLAPFSNNNATQPPDTIHASTNTGVGRRASDYQPPNAETGARSIGYSAFAPSNVFTHSGLSHHTSSQSAWTQSTGGCGTRLSAAHGQAGASHGANTVGATYARVWNTSGSDLPFTPNQGSPYSGQGSPGEPTWHPTNPSRGPTDIPDSRNNLSAAPRLEAHLNERNRNYAQVPPSNRRTSAVPSDRGNVAYPVSPNSSNESEVMCSDCGNTYSGEYRKGNLARHRRQKHGKSEQSYPCEEPLCQQKFKRQDARLKHYRKHHPERTLHPPLPRRSGSSS